MNTFVSAVFCMSLGYVILSVKFLVSIFILKFTLEVHLHTTNNDPDSFDEFKSEFI